MYLGSGRRGMVVFDVCWVGIVSRFREDEGGGFGKTERVFLFGIRFFYCLFERMGGGKI